MRILRWILAPLAALIAVIAGLVVLATAVVVMIFVFQPTDTGGQDRIAGLGNSVSVLRDRHSVPHIFANTPIDAYRALGFVHAQDRFFQMEFARRTAAGRLSEIIGPPGLRSDRFMRTLGIPHLAEASVETLSVQARAAVEGYAEGVNAWLEGTDTRLPAELIVLGHRPEPWRAADSAAWVRLMALLLAGDWRTEILKAQLSESLSTEQLRDLWPDEPENSPTTLALAPGTRKQLAALATGIPDIFPEASASNAWVVAGSRSQSGKPLLANDPHLGLNAPGMWHLARIVTPHFNASGAAIPGQPFFMVGQNGHLAWGLTTTHADTQDLFIERLNPDDPTQYLTPTGSLPFTTRVETIHVRGRAAPVHQTVRSTRHGPVISDISSNAAALTKSDTVIALSFAALRDDDRTADAIYGMNTARSVTDFQTALRDFHAPMQNVAYAHTDGSFGFVAAGRLPIRPDGPGNVPHEGWTGANDWAGFVPFEDQPQALSPEAGLIANANNRVAARDYPHVIANDWPAGFRAQRILDLLSAKPRHSIDSFAAIQNDEVSLGARTLAHSMIKILAPDDTPDPVVGAFDNWDGDMSANQRLPLIYAAWSKALRARLVDDELGAHAAAFRGVPVRSMGPMLSRQSAWCDDINTAQPETCDTIVHASLIDALAELDEAHGNDRDTWRWGDGHIAAFAHPLLRFIGPVAKFVGPHISTGGGNHTINRGTYRSKGGGKFPHVHGPGLRAIFDMAHPGEARFMIAPGQSGHLNSPHYADLAPTWQAGDYIVLKGDLESLRNTATSELTLTP